MRILLIEDDAVLRGVMHASLTDAGHRVDEAPTLADARTLWLVQQFDAVLHFVVHLLHSRLTLTPRQAPS